MVQVAGQLLVASVDGVCQAVPRTMLHQGLEPVVFQENEKGTLKPGKLADVVILDKDILLVEPGQIEKINVCVTIKSGEILYNSLG